VLRYRTEIPDADAGGISLDTDAQLRSLIHISFASFDEIHGATIFIDPITAAPNWDCLAYLCYIGR
jgi:hypothetical protein